MRSKVTAIVMIMLSSNFQSVISDSPQHRRKRRKRNVRGVEQNHDASHIIANTIETIRSTNVSTRRRHAENTNTIGVNNIFQSTDSTRIREVKCEPKEGEQDRFKVRRCNNTCNKKFTRNCNRVCDCYNTKRKCRDSKGTFRFMNSDGDEMVKGCVWVRRKSTEERCAIDATIARHCFATCNPLICQ